MHALSVIASFGTDPHSLLLYGSATVALAVGGLAWGVLDWLCVPRAQKEDLGIYEFLRRERLREGSIVYRWFEPIIEPLAKFIAEGRTLTMNAFGRSLSLARTPLRWKPEEFLASAYVEGVLVAVTVFVIGVVVTSSVGLGLTLALVCGLTYAPMVKRGVQSKAETRLKAIRFRMPFVMDLISLTMEAGASFLESLEIAVKENPKHPLGEEFNEVLRDINVGRTRREALEALEKRLADPDVSEIVFAIVKGEELGTPLGNVLRNQADQIRLKRSQWAEKAAAEAQVNIVFPGLVIMVACLLIVLAPFVMSALNTQR